MNTLSQNPVSCKLPQTEVILNVFFGFDQILSPGTAAVCVTVLDTTAATVHFSY